MKLTRRILSHQLKPMDLSHHYYNQQLVQKLLKFMKDEKGIGLAANQVGLRDRCFVMEIDEQQWGCFNPEIVEMGSDLTKFNEGCLSFPGESCILLRPEEIRVRYFDANGVEHVETLTGLASRCFQHELDHLNGITMWDRYKEQNAEQSRN